MHSPVSSYKNNWLPWLVYSWYRAKPHKLKTAGIITPLFFASFFLGYQNLALSLKSKNPKALTLLSILSNDIASDRKLGAVAVFLFLCTGSTIFGTFGRSRTITKISLTSLKVGGTVTAAYLAGLVFKNLQTPIVIPPIEEKKSIENPKTTLEEIAEFLAAIDDNEDPKTIIHQNEQGFSWEGYTMLYLPPKIHEKLRDKMRASFPEEEYFTKAKHTYFMVLFNEYARPALPILKEWVESGTIS